MNYHHTSPFRSFHEKCRGVFYDYRKIASIFCCYSFIGTGLILGASSLFGEEAVWYQLSGQTGQEDTSDALIAEAAAFQEQNTHAILEKLHSDKISYRLTDTDSSQSTTESVSDSSAESAADISQQEASGSIAENAENEQLASSEKKQKKTTKESTAALPYDRSCYSGKEIRILEKIVEAEAGDQSVKGRMMVADVVLNRVSSKEFPDTIKEVVFQKTDSVYQFSPIKDGRYFNVTVSAKTKKAVQKAFESEDITDGALYFMSRSGSSKKNIAWFDSSLTKITSYGCHEFFK
jgi:N-acetylmuramoyl-L-alanine amidase